MPANIDSYITSLKTHLDNKEDEKKIAQDELLDLLLTEIDTELSNAPENLEEIPVNSANFEKIVISFASNGYRIHAWFNDIATSKDTRRLVKRLIDKPITTTLDSKEYNVLVKGSDQGIATVITFEHKTP